MAQEKGRSGRARDAQPSQNVYSMFGSLKSYVHLIRRFYMPLSQETQATVQSSQRILKRHVHQQQQVDALHEVLEVFVLPTECLHCALERRLANPFIAFGVPNDRVPLPPCVDYCDFCTGAYLNQLVNVVKDGVRSVLIDIFLTLFRQPKMDGELVTLICKYPDSHRKIFGSISNTAPPPKKVKTLILMLITSNIITHNIVYDDNDTAKVKPIVVARLNYEANGSLSLFQEGPWTNIPQRLPNT